MIRSHHTPRLLSLSLILGLAILLGCDKKSKDENLLPDTHIALESINLTGNDRLNSIVTLNWFGTDKDGYVVGYELSFDQANWEYVTTQDSTFSFSIDAGSDTVDIDIYIRSIDDHQARDASPAVLTVPLKNTPPTVTFNTDLLPPDSVSSVISLSWSVDDLDGIETIDSTLMRINNGTWYPLNKDAEFASIIPTTPEVMGAGTGIIYYGSNDPQPNPIDGLTVGDTNNIQIRVVDIAGSSSIVASSGPIYVRQKTSDLLVIGANQSNPNSFYSGILSTVYPSYDFVNFISNGGENQPRYWNPTFKLTISLYDKILLYADEATHVDALTNQSQLILELGASALQEYLNEGGKALISTGFPAGLLGTSAVFQTMPMDSLSSSSGQATLDIDTTLTGQFPEYGTLKTSSFVLGLDPFYPTADAEVMYTAQLTANGGWTGPTNIAARRKFNGNINQVFFGIEIHKLNGDPAAVSALLDQILNNDFNW